MSEDVVLEKNGKVVARHGVMRVQQADGSIVAVPCVDRRSKRADDNMQRKLRKRAGSPTALSDVIPDDVNPPRDTGDESVVVDPIVDAAAALDDVEFE